MGASLAVAASVEESTRAAVDALAAALEPIDPALVFVFHDAGRDATEVAERLVERLPRALSLGCSTSGELGPLGMTEGGLAAFALAEPVRVSFEHITDLDEFRFDQGAALIGRLAMRLGVRPERLDPRRHLLVTLIGCMGIGQETLTAALADVVPGLPLVGGSAGDGLRFDRATTFADGRAAVSSAVVALLQPGRAFQAFGVHHFHAGDERLVVTGADPSTCRVWELNGWPAVEEYARVAKVEPADLRAGTVLPGSLPVHLGFRVGERLYMRAVMAVRDDALVLGGAVGEGMVLRVALGDDLVGATRSGVDNALAALGTRPAGMLLFNCVGRLLQARSTGLAAAMWEAMSPIPSAGFSTQGEQYGPILVNYTLTGVVFAHAPGAIDG